MFRCEHKRTPDSAYASRTPSMKGEIVLTILRYIVPSFREIQFRRSSFFSLTAQPRLSARDSVKIEKTNRTDQFERIRFLERKPPTHTTKRNNSQTPNVRFQTITFPFASSRRNPFPRIHFRSRITSRSRDSIQPFSRG